MNQSKEMTNLQLLTLEDKKANDVRVIDIAGVSVIADYFVIASGSNTNQYRPWLTAFVRPLAEQAMNHVRWKATAVLTGS